MTLTLARRDQRCPRPSSTSASAPTLPARRASSACRRGRLRGGARGRARAGRERRADHRREHGRRPARRRAGDDDVPAAGRVRAGYRAGAGDDRLVEVERDRGRAEVRAGQGDRQLDQPQGGRGAVPRVGAQGAPLRRRRGGDGVRRGGPGRRRSSGRSRSASAPTTCSPSAPGSTPRTSSSTPTSSPSRPGSPSTTTTPRRSSRRPGRSRSDCPARASPAACPTCRSRSAATNRCGRRCTPCSSTTRSPPGSTWRSSTRASSPRYEEIEPELRERVEDVILNRRTDATERLLEIAERYRGARRRPDASRSRVARAARRASGSCTRSSTASTSTSSRTPRRRVSSCGEPLRGDRGAADGRDERRRRPLRRRARCSCRRSSSRRA